MKNENENENNHDEKLVNFLQKYAPKAPPISPVLEQKILSSLQTQTTSRMLPISFALTASLLLFLIGQWPRPMGPPVALESLEQFIETSWQGTIAANSDLEYQETLTDLGLE